MARAAAITRLHDPTLALAISETAHRHAPSSASAISLMNCTAETGELAQARQLLAHARALAVTETEREEVMQAELMLALFAEHDHDAAIAALDAATAAGVLCRPGVIGSFTALVELNRARPDRAGAAALAVIADGSAVPDARLRSAVSLATAQVLEGRTGDAIATARGALRLADELRAEMPTSAGMLRLVAGFAALWRGELPEVLKAHPANGRWPSPPGIGQGPESAADADTADGFRWPLLAGVVAHLRGDHAEAITQLRAAVVQQSSGLGHFAPEASAWLVVALCDGGNPIDAEAAMARYPDRGVTLLPGLRDWATGVVAASSGRRDEAVRALTAAADAAREVGADLCEARYLIDLAERCDAVDVIDRLGEFAGSIDAPVLALMCRASVARLGADLDEMVACATAFAALGFSARSSAVSRDVERLARAIGDVALARRAGRLRRGLRESPSGHPGLTARESEVAALAAGGLADREIAARLVVSVRTVESHLARTYRKLGVSSRADLAGVLSCRSIA
jgi:DNA-binding NarL/FixJ family response regulator